MEKGVFSMCICKIQNGFVIKSKVIKVNKLPIINSSFKPSQAG